MGPFFTHDTLRFLRALKRNNNREWFGRRKTDYERHVRAPMLAVIDQLAVDFRSIAPEMIASPKSSLYRVYRDTRFSEDKTPYKIHVAAGFRWRGLEKRRRGRALRRGSPGLCGWAVDSGRRRRGTW